MAKKPPIQTMVERMLEAKRLDYQFAKAALDVHLKSLNDEAFEAEVDRVTNVEIFGTLWSMGMNRRRQEACTRKAGELYAAKP